MVDPATRVLAALHPQVLVDGIMAKTNTGACIDDAPLVIALGPGFVAGRDCHVVVETNRGHNLGRALWQGSAEPDTGQPGALPGSAARSSRVLRAPIAGRVTSRHAIGASLSEGAIVATVTDAMDATAAVHAPFDGVLRGLIHPTVWVTAGMKIGDVDPRARPAYCFTVSDKSLAVAGGVLEAILTAQNRSIHPGSSRTSSQPEKTD